eukprot:scaffold359_cov103-Isochrysis_galbana.AAC.1
MPGANLVARTSQGRTHPMEGNSRCGSGSTVSHHIAAAATSRSSLRPSLRRVIAVAHRMRPVATPPPGIDFTPR